MKRKRKGSLSFIVLNTLENVIDGYVRFEDFAYNPKLYTYGYDRHLKKSSLAQAIKRLKVSGLIEDVIVGNQLMIKLSQTGKQFINLKEPGDDWDGKWRVVIFDIPEQKRIVRNLFRRNLKKWGFKQLQKSVWVSKKDIYQQVSGYVEGLGIGQWVNVFEANKLKSNIQ